jgi:hypothetical protein
MNVVDINFHFFEILAVICRHRNCDIDNKMNVQRFKRDSYSFNSRSRTAVIYKPVMYKLFEFNLFVKINYLFYRESLVNFSIKITYTWYSEFTSILY